jgi:thioredoxin reductase (NADPH)
MGPEMMDLFRKQAVRLGTDVRFGMVTGVEFKQGGPQKVWVDGTKEIIADAVIISTGASAKWLGIPSEQRLNGGGVSACAVCDGFFYRGSDVAIVGAGDTACEEAAYLSKICSKVYMIVRKDHFRASKAMQHRVENTPNIEILFNSETDEILGDQVVEGVRVKNNETGELREIPIKGFFVAIGHDPNTKVFKPYLEMDEQGYIVTRPGSTYTNIEGVFCAGDAQDKVYRQAVTAAGSGCMAALDAERWLAARHSTAFTA